LLGIEDHMMEDLLNLVGINLDRPELRREEDVAPDIGTAQRKVHRVVHQVRDRHGSPHGCAPSREGEELASQLGGTPTGVFGGC
jgi:hypothetical protein